MDLPGKMTFNQNARTSVSDANCPSVDEREQVVASRTDDEKERPSEQKSKGCGIFTILVENPFVSWMLIFIPLGVIAWALEWSDTAIFCLNFMGIVPQAWLIGKATEDLALHLGKTTPMECSLL